MDYSASAEPRCHRRLYLNILAAGGFDPPVLTTAAVSSNRPTVQEDRRRFRPRPIGRPSAAELVISLTGAGQAIRVPVRISRRAGKDSTPPVRLAPLRRSAYHLPGQPIEDWTIRGVAC